MPPAVVLLNYLIIRQVVLELSRFFPQTGIFRGGFSIVQYLSLLPPEGIAKLLWAGRGTRSGHFFARYWASKDECAQRTGAHGFFILVSYILLAKLYSPHEVHSHCLFMQSGILMLFLFQRKANIAKSRPVLQISDWQTPRPSPHLLHCWQFMYSVCVEGWIRLLCRFTVSHYNSSYTKCLIFKKEGNCKVKLFFKEKKITIRKKKDGK